MTTLACRNDRRRIAVRQSPKLAGFDYVEVSEDHLTLHVYFLGRLPETPLTRENFRIEGGRRVRDIRVVDVFPNKMSDPELDDYADVVVDRFGDFSEYTISAVTRVTDDYGGSRWVPHPEFDPFYNRLAFRFTAGCPTELDCPPDEVCPPPNRVQPAINYLAKDYASFRQLILDRLAVVMPGWRNRFVPDIGITLVELLAYAGDYLSYYQDAVATEAYLDTARQRISVRRHARLVDYAIHEGCNARAFVVVSTTSDLRVEPGGVQFITPPAKNLPVELTRERIASVDPGTFQVFEAMAPTELHPGHDTISIYTWGDRECCLRRGATTATLVDDWIGEYDKRTRKLKLQPGDFLIFEEVAGPRTGKPADRDPSHRWAVRLTSVVPDVDPLSDTPVVNIAWAKDDALPFPLCLSAIGPPPECELVTDVTVARSNVVLVDHGRTIEEDLPPVPFVESAPICDGEGVVGDVTRSAASFYPRLTFPDLTFRELPDPKAPAARVLVQNPHLALPILALGNGKWTPVEDLFGSLASDKRFVAEMDNDRVAWLRFGDGTHGAFPPPAVSLHARYRIGAGAAGNVGAEAIAHIVWTSNVSKFITTVRNPLAARGGVEPQPIQEVKLVAPRAFRKRLERAITADDYAVIAQREFPLEVQRAAATLRWNGSWYEALVAIDPFESQPAGPSLLGRVRRRLEIYRRIGHDLRVEAATRVPVLIRLSICVKSVYLRAHVLADLQARFGTTRLSDGRLGFFHSDNLTFGGALHLSKLVSEAQSVPGVESVRVRAFERMFDGPRGEIDAGLIRFGPFEIAQCDSDPSAPDNGQIRFDVGGGR
jgi:hypothetical protein